MSDPALFLNAFARALGVMSLYPSGHPARERTIEAAYRHFDEMTAGNARPSFTFLEDEVVYGRESLHEMRAWAWGRRLAEAGVQRLEVERRVSREEFDEFLREVAARLTASVDTCESSPMRSLGIRFGPVGLDKAEDNTFRRLREAVRELRLAEEVETIRWIHDEVRAGGVIPLLEAEAIIRSLSAAMHSDRHIVLPLLQLKDFDQYTTTHSLNVAVLAMGLAERLGCGSGEVHAFGVAGLLHDIGKTRVPLEVLTKPGALTPSERSVMNRHPVDGARIILQSEENLDLAAAVAYEHHVMLNGCGYPGMHYSRECTLASRLVHVCDVFDALGTRRPYREAWPMERTLAYLDERAGTEFDPGLVGEFTRMLRQREAEVLPTPLEP